MVGSMPRSWSAARLAPLTAGLAGLAWFWFELAPQRAGFPDTDDPAVGLRFLAADPVAWPLGGLALAIAAIALVATVITIRDRLEAAEPAPGVGAAGRAIAPRVVSAIGLVAAGFLIGQATTRMAGGPVQYVQGLDQGWGETAYLVTQFVGVQLFAVGGLALLAIWAVGVAWLSARRGVMPRGVALLAVIPGFRLLGILGVLHLQPEGLWIFYLASIPGSFAWLLVLGAMSPGDTLARVRGSRPHEALDPQEARG